MIPPDKKLKLGIDLSGGTILVYEVARENLGPNFNMDELISALKQRADPQGVKETPIRKIGSNRIEIILPLANDEEVEEVKKMLTDVGSLEFRILANRKHDAAAVDRALGPQGLAKPPARYKWARLGEISTGTNPTFTSDTITDLQQKWKKDLYAGTDVILTGKGDEGPDQTVSIPVSRNTANTLDADSSPRLEVDQFLPDRVQPQRHPWRRSQQSPTRPTRSSARKKSHRAASEIYILCTLDRQNVTGSFLSRAYATTDERLQPAVGFQFNRQGARRFGQLTREHLPEEGDAFKYQLAILLDNLVMSAPSINSEIRDSGIIEGGGQGFKPKEVEHLINILQAGSLPASLNPTPAQEEKVGPTLGEDSIAKGWRAIWVSMLVVPVFMVIYYRFAGIVAVIALVANMILLIGTMAFMQATFSLPGLAGLALTIGMAVDANVLVFERMREEKERGASIAQQIRNGFNRAWVTIFDSHVTNLLAAIVLYAVGTEEVKGFALTMIIGMLWNLYTAVFMSRVIFEIAYAQGWIKQLRDAQDVGQDQHRLHRPALLLHGRLADPHLSLAWSPSSPAAGRCITSTSPAGRWSPSGSMSPTRPSSRSPNRSGRSSSAQKASVLPDVTVESLRVGNDTKLARFNIRTTATDQDSQQEKDKVKNKILEAFGPALAKVEMTVGDAKPIPGAAAGDASKTSPALTTRFAGGREYPLSFNTTAFNSTQAPAQVVAAEFAKVLEGAGIANPTTRFEISEATSQGIRHGNARTSCCGPTWSRILPRPRSASSRSRWPATATFSSSESRSSAAPSPARREPSP